MIQNRFFIAIFFCLFTSCATSFQPVESGFKDDRVLCSTPEFQALYAAFQHYCQKTENIKQCGSKNSWFPEGVLMAKVSDFCIKSEQDDVFTKLSKKQLLQEQRLLISLDPVNCYSRQIWVVRKGTKWKVIKVADVKVEDPCFRF